MKLFGLFSCLRREEVEKPKMVPNARGLGNSDEKSKAPVTISSLYAEHFEGKTSIVKELEALGIDKTKCQEGRPFRKRDLWLQALAAISASVALIACGGHVGWTSPALPYLEREYGVSKVQSSWIASLYTLGGILGSLLSPLLLERLGRKGSLLMFAGPQIVGWSIVIPARSVELLLLARFVAGVGHGGIFNVATIYMGEIADRRVRGAFGTLLKLSVNLGGLFATTAGAFLPYQQLNLVELGPPLLFVASFVFMPESPYFYLSRGQTERATACVLRLRRRKSLDEPLRRELDSMQRDALENRDSEHQGGLVRLLCENRRAVWIVLALKFTQHMSGHQAIVSYTQEIFGYSYDSSEGGSLGPEHWAIVLGLAQLAAGLLAALLVDRLGRRPLILVSGLAAAFCLALVGYFFFVKEELGRDASHLVWLPATGIIGYEIFVSFGIGTIPYVLLGEIFPANLKGTAVAMAIVVGSLFGFLVSFGYQHVVLLLGVYPTFWIFAACCAAGTICIYVITPETKGKSLEEIQIIINPKRSQVYVRPPSMTKV
ncbi:facilitated trehalose transporter Tret1-like [Trichogramma pretiosum]|uniref:facilitated trehalose transporter Tret1-like n=1 Tax=Trichogramma pretiosum TaxID=7493 RepID=UPI0006C9DFB4|nr:facilitated trehalose transporter Tret1-like [Trichogramma pretiosum]